jgi:uncharacterized Zn finger protein
MNEKIEFITYMRSRGEKSNSALKKAYEEKFNTTKDFSANLKVVDSMFSEYFKKTIEELAPEIALHYWDLYAKSYKLQDYRECRAILKELRDLTGQFEEKQPVEKPVKKASILELRKKHG